MIKEDISENSIFKNTLKLLFLLMSCRILKKCFKRFAFTKNSQAKLITVLSGKIFDVCVDCRKSKTFGKQFSIVLSIKITNLY